MMKAAFIRKTGKPDVIEWGTLPTPVMKENEVLVKVSAVAANPIDTYIRSGHLSLPSSVAMPYILGSDMVGTIEKVGSSVQGFAVGERVWTSSAGVNSPQGTFAESIAINADYVYRVPDNVEDLALVAVIQSATTACLGLLRVAQLRVNDILFVNGAGGNVGSAIIQIAKARGSKVIAATSSQEKLDWCKRLGADLVLDYKKNNFEEKVKEFAPEGATVFWDTSRHPDFNLSTSLLAHRGRIVLMAGADARPEFPVGPFYRKELSMGSFMLKYASALELRQCADLINLSLERGLLKGKVAEVLPLSQAAKSHEIMESNPDLWGKIVLTAGNCG
jgi:NADPH2:quinone reductase